MGGSQRFEREPSTTLGMRGMSSTTAAIVLVVVVVVVGAGAYAAFRNVGPTSNTVSACSPPTSPGCTGLLPIHDVSLLSPIRSTQQGTTVPFTAAVPSGEKVLGYRFNFGDGSTQSSATPSVDHVFQSAGNYIVSVQANVSGVWHDNYRALVVLTVTNSFATASAGALPGVGGTILANSTSSVSPSGVLQPGQAVTVEGAYSSLPTDPSWTVQSPQITATGGTVTTSSNTSTTSTATVRYSAPGVYTIDFIGGSSKGSVVAHQLYVWTVFVAAAGDQASLRAGAFAVSPHPGTIEAYEDTPGGTYTSDPAIDYDIVGFEIIINVYQTLVFYNGTQTGQNPDSYVPVLATCVPGSAECQSLYGTSLVSGDNFTFVVSSAAHFYDPATGNSWGVYPSDVVFSLARTMGFSVLPCVGCNNGWILTQSLLPNGNYSWDGGFHAPYNNTPQNIFDSMDVNGSACPAAAMTNDHGCVTFHVNGGGLNWPYFLQLIGDTEGAGIVPCGWFSAPAQGAGIPYWTAGTITGSGDHPCTLPGGATSTGDASFQAAVAAMPATGWDNWENVGSGATGTYLGNVQNNMVGSGPYYMANYQVGLSYELAANPAYQQNPDCTWSACQPPAGKYAKTVDVLWEASPVYGEQAMAAGIADYAGIPSTDFGTLVQLAQEGKLIALSIPTVNIYFFPFDLAFSVVDAKKYTTNPLTVPSDWFSNVGIREFFAHAYPYSTIQQTINTKDGIETGFPYGGAIPQFLADYYPRNVSWPASDPCTNATNIACASYWWNAVNDPSSTVYDPEVSGCTTQLPCEFPIFGVIGDPDTDQRLGLWASEISQISGGKVRVDPVDLPEADIVTGQFSSPGQNFAPLYSIRWVPDYPDPTDYVRPLYYPDNVFTYSSAVAEQFALSAFNSSSCHSGTDYVYWANQPVIPNDCQGAAFEAMNVAFGLAAPLPDGAQRVLLYNLGEHIANSLALYVYMYQQNLVPALGPWIDPGSFNANVVIGAGGDTPWFWITGNSVQYAGSA